MTLQGLVVVIDMTPGESADCPKVQQNVSLDRSTTAPASVRSVFALPGVIMDRMGVAPSSRAVSESTL